MRKTFKIVGFAFAVIFTSCSKENQTEEVVDSNSIEVSEITSIDDTYDDCTDDNCSNLGINIGDNDSDIEGKSTAHLNNFTYRSAIYNNTSSYQLITDSYALMKIVSRSGDNVTLNLDGLDGISTYLKVDNFSFNNDGSGIEVTSNRLGTTGRYTRAQICRTRTNWQAANGRVQSGYWDRLKVWNANSTSTKTTLQHTNTNNGYNGRYMILARVYFEGYGNYSSQWSQWMKMSI